MSLLGSAIAAPLDDPVAAVTRAYERIADVDRDEIWISLRDREEALAEAVEVGERRRQGEDLPLAGATLAVKDNIDVGATATTAGCPEFAYVAARDAPVIAGLRCAGAIVLGKTNLDQFATGLVGTRSPYGAVRDAQDPARVSGGSSSGSAVAVALGLADIGIGTDTAGSGRVPAAFQGIIGVKPTQALLSRDGVVPACPSFDCVSVLCADLRLAERALSVLVAQPVDWRGGTWPVTAPLAAPERPRIATPGLGDLDALSPDALRAWHEARDRMERRGARLVEIDLTPFWRAGELLYDGAFVAERYAAVGRFIADHRGAVDPSVASIILGARDISAADYAGDSERLEGLRSQAAAALEGCDALLLPTVPFQPTIAAVRERPIEINRELGRFTTFCNPLGMCAVAVPAGRADGGSFGVSLLAPAFHDRVILDIAGRLVGTPARDRPAPPSVSLLVLGAHLTGQPLNRQLLDRGATLIGTARTSDAYRLYRLATAPPKPGLVRCRAGDQGASIAGELWALSPGALADLLAALPRPMTFGHVELEDGSEVLGFLCEPEATEGALEITSSGGWRAHLEEV